MATKINKENEKSVVETLKEIRLQPNMECGVDEIEFPDGTKEKFYYNGENDRQAAIKFATICVNATNNTAKAKKMMVTCYQLMINNIVPERIITVEDVGDLYLDVEKKALYTSFGTEYVSLSKEEKDIDMSTDVLAMFLKERAERKAENAFNIYDNDDCDSEEDEEDW